MIVWVQLPALKVHFYHREVLMTLGNLIGRTIKLDYHTLNRQRRKFAHLAVEIDMSKPLVPRIFLDDYWQKVEYENLPVVYFECGKIGHNTDACPLLRPAANLLQVTVACDGTPAEPARSVEESNLGFGPWMLVSKKSRRNSRDSSKNGKAEADMGSGGQGKATGYGKGGIRIKEMEESTSTSKAPKAADLQRTQNQERKGIQTLKEGSSSGSMGKNNKGKEVLQDSKGQGKGLLGPGPKQGNSGMSGPRPTSGPNQASTSASKQVQPSPQSTPTGPPFPQTGAALQTSRPTETTTLPEVQTVVGENGTSMRIFSVVSSPKKHRQTETKSPSAGERFKQKKAPKKQSKKGTPVKLSPLKALQVWSPVKDRKAKSRARMATLTLQEINAWTEAAGKVGGISEREEAKAGNTDLPEVTPGMDSASPVPQ
ncbi:unnamed protein product [Linum tenue]|uniref:DUF4283 domain-containing protein n=1 Tax=Linum tenue TaxID=586396 RepID=A0AAV0QUI7_9ROSI|nr:unnamed protein product [Linum tenue]